METELELIAKIKSGDDNARNIFLLSKQKFVRTVVLKALKSTNHSDFDDLVNDCLLCLNGLIEKFDSSKCASFEGFSRPILENLISLEYYANNDKQFLNIYKVYSSMSENGEKISVDELYDECQKRDLKVSIEKVQAFFSYSLLKRASLDQMFESGVEITEPTVNVNSSILDELEEFMDVLNDREIKALDMKFRVGYKNKEIAEALNLTPSNCSAFIRTALAKLKLARNKK